MRQHPIERRLSRIAAASNQKATRLGTIGRICSVDMFHVYEEADGFCTYCGIGITPMDCSFDHVTPFDKGGLNWRDNIVACCISCQRSKFTKSPAELAEWQALTRTCPIDGTVFRPRWSEYKRGLGFYCSRRCSGAMGGMMKSAKT